MPSKNKLKQSLVELSFFNPADPEAINIFAKAYNALKNKPRNTRINSPYLKPLREKLKEAEWALKYYSKESLRKISDFCAKPANRPAVLSAAVEETGSASYKLLIQFTDAYDNYIKLSHTLVETIEHSESDSLTKYVKLLDLLQAEIDVAKELKSKLILLGNPALDIDEETAKKVNGEFKKILNYTYIHMTELMHNALKYAHEIDSDDEPYVEFMATFLSVLQDSVDEANKELREKCRTLIAEVVKSQLNITGHVIGL